jgi:hypothetical protein
VQKGIVVDLFKEEISHVGAQDLILPSTSVILRHTSPRLASDVAQNSRD